MVKLKRKSWHFWLAEIMDDSVGYRETSMCDYVWHVFAGGLIFLFVNLLSITSMITFLAGILDSVYFWYQVVRALILHTKFPKDGFAISYTIFLIMLGLLFAGIAYQDKRERARRARKQNQLPEKQPSFLVLAWRTIREKTCVKISFD